MTLKRMLKSVFNKNKIPAYRLKLSVCGDFVFICELVTGIILIQGIWKLYNISVC
jgi:hypothetical protein